MDLILKQKITINHKVLPLVNDIIIKTSRNTFTDTAVFTFPNKINAQNQKISELIELGSPVKIEIGYEPFLFTEFEGYVSQIVPEKTATIFCENETYKLKRQSIGRDVILKQTSTLELIKEIYDGKVEVYEANIGDWKVSKNATVIQVLSELQAKFKIYSYFRGDVLIVGSQADPLTQNRRYLKAHFQKNIPTGESNFNFKNASADLIIVKASALNRKGEKKAVFAYYSGTPAKIIYSQTKPKNGTVNEFNIGGQSEISITDLKRLAKIRLEALSFTGCDGSVTIYGFPKNPCANHGEICQIIDNEVPEKNGNYAIVSVTKKFGKQTGFRQILELGISI